MRHQSPATLGTWALFCSPADFFSMSFHLSNASVCCLQKPKGIMTSVVTLKHGLGYKEVRYHGGSCYSLKRWSCTVWCSAALLLLVGKGPARVSSVLMEHLMASMQENCLLSFFPPVLAVEAKTHNKVKRVLMTICRHV